MVTVNMKTQVRRGVFETNSSSTHSLQLTDRNKEDILTFIRERTPDNRNDNVLRPESFIHAKELNLEGFYLPEGGEEGNVYNVISTWAAKLQYLAMYIDCNTEYNHDDCVKDLCDFALAFYKSKGYDVETVEFSLDHELTWVESECSEIPNLTFCSKVFETHDSRMEFMQKFMEDQYSIIFMDEAYHGWETTEINFY